MSLPAGNQQWTFDDDGSFEAEELAPFTDTTFWDMDLEEFVDAELKGLRGGGEAVREGEREQRYQVGAEEYGRALGGMAGGMFGVFYIILKHFLLFFCSRCPFGMFFPLSCLMQALPTSPIKAYCPKSATFLTFFS